MMTRRQILATGVTLAGGVWAGVALDRKNLTQAIPHFKGLDVPPEVRSALASFSFRKSIPDALIANLAITAPELVLENSGVAKLIGNGIPFSLTSVQHLDFLKLEPVKRYLEFSAGQTGRRALPFLQVRQEYGFWSKTPLKNAGDLVGKIGRTSAMLASLYGSLGVKALNKSRLWTQKNLKDLDFYELSSYQADREMDAPSFFKFCYSYAPVEGATQLVVTVPEEGYGSLSHRQRQYLRDDIYELGQIVEVAWDNFNRRAEQEFRNRGVTLSRQQLFHEEKDLLRRQTAQILKAQGVPTELISAFFLPLIGDRLT